MLLLEETVVDTDTEGEEEVVVAEWKEVKHKCLEIRFLQGGASNAR